MDTRAEGLLLAPDITATQGGMKLGNMRTIAVIAAAALVFATVAPAFAQPFADVPTNHWAYDAIAELAAKGLIEGYPDGTFKGDRAMTRYEMAMVVARLLARIESIQIPAPTPPEVTKADIDAINRLVNEFRAELAALGVRTTAIEEELNAIKARLDNVRVTGGLRFREDVVRDSYGTQTGQNRTGTPQNIVSGSPGSWDLGAVAVNGTASGVGAGTAQYLQSGASSPFGVNGNPRSSQIDASVAPTTNRPRYEFKLGFDGSVMPDIHYVIGLLTSGGYQIFNSGDQGNGTTAAAVGLEGNAGAFGNGSFGEIDSAFLQWNNAWGLPLTIMLGRFGDNTPCGGGCYPIQWGPFGLIMNDNSDTWEDTTDSGGFNQADGLRIQSHIPSLADLQFEFAIIRIQGGNGSPFNAQIPQTASSQYIFGEDAYGANVNVRVLPGVRVGLDYVANTITPANNTAGPGGFGNIAQWHIYGPSGGGVNPGLGSTPVASSGFHCVSVTSATSPGIACPAAGNGWDGYLQWDIVPGIHFDGEFAQWNDTVFNTTDNGYEVNVHWDLGSLTGIGHGFSLDTGYENFGQNFYPPYGGADIDINENDMFYPGNGNAWTVGIHITPITNWTLYGVGAFGNFASNGQQLSAYEVGVVYNFVQNASIVFKVREERIANIEQFLLYRAQIDYSF